MHVQLIEEPAAGPDLAKASYQAAEDPVMDASVVCDRPGRSERCPGDGFERRRPGRLLEVQAPLEQAARSGSQERRTDRS